MEVVNSAFLLVHFEPITTGKIQSGISHLRFKTDAKDMYMPMQVPYLLLPFTPHKQEASTCESTMQNKRPSKEPLSWKPCNALHRKSIQIFLNLAGSQTASTKNHAVTL